MGADAFFVFFGLRYELGSEDEVEAVEARSDSRVRRARAARLQFALVRPTDRESHVLLVGAALAIMGIENQMSAALSESEFAARAADTREKLLNAGFAGEPELHFQINAQY